MAFTIAVRVSVLVALLAVPAEAFGASTIRTSSVTGRLVVPGGHPSSIRLHCPAEAVALNGAVTRQGSGVVVQRSVPGRDAGGWAFRVAASGSGSRSVSAVLRCVRLELPAGLMGARLDVRTRHQSSIDIAPGATTTTRLGCGRAWTGTGYALDSGRRADVRLTQVVPFPHGWRFTLENTGSATAHAGVSARCVRSTVTARRAGGGSAQLTFGVARPSFAATFAASEGRRTAFRNCGTSRFSLATGVSVDPADSIEFLTGAPTRRRGNRLIFRNVTNGDGFRGFLACLRTGSAFH
jgi:hypothetical protein